MRKRHIKIRGLMLATVVSAAVAALIVPVAAQAEPGGPDGANVQAHFFDCTGPAGTPTSFDAESQHLGSAWRIADRFSSD